MDKKEQLISRIIDIEWESFHNVPNIGGPAACQEDRKTFEINRFAQAISWSESVLESYMNDLLEARNNKRNLMTEKYGRMMEFTSPEEYAQIQHMLPPLAPDVPPLIDNILKIELKWQGELQDKYPNIIKKGRPLYSFEDTRYQTSFETYLRGELSTYSLKTLKLYYENIVEQKSKDINGGELTLENMVKSYGFNSAKEANESLGHKTA